MSRYGYDGPREERRDRGDEVQNSRLFILCGKGIQEDRFKSSFDKFGRVKDVWIVKDRRTNEDKGIAYVTYSKASEAALAMEEMNGRCMEDHPRPLKIMIASDRTQGSGKEPKEEEKMLRLFVVVPKSFSDQELREAFSEFGDIDNASVLKDRFSGANKGFGYVKFHRAYHAALALENCDRSYKPKFAEPRMTPAEREELNYRRESDRSMRRRGDDDRMSRSFMDRDHAATPRIPLLPERGPAMRGAYSDEANTSCSLSVLTSNTTSEDQLTRLFDLIPDFQYCELDRMSGVCYVKYANTHAASYAKRKLEGFEYPMGYRLAVKYSNEVSSSRGAMHDDRYDRRDGGHVGSDDRDSQTQQRLQNLLSDPVGGNLQTLVDTIQKATSIIQSAGLAVNSQAPGTNYSCSATLPAKQPLASPEAPVAQRLFLVLHMTAIPTSMLIDIFCRFGNLIDVYMIAGKNYGYAKFASKDSAQHAIDVLHLQEINGYRIKVIEAEPPKNEGHSMKRMRPDDE